MIRTKWSPSVRVYTSLQRSDGTTLHEGTGYDGVSTLTASVPAGGTCKIAVRNASTSLAAQLSIDRVDFTASSY